MGYISTEEEASLINNYLNSFKIRKEETVKKDESVKKTMKELIAEALLEKQLKTELLKKQLDWDSLGIVLKKDQLENLKNKRCNNMHF